MTTLDIDEENAPVKCVAVDVPSDTLIYGSQSCLRKVYSRF